MKEVEINVLPRSNVATEQSTKTFIERKILTQKSGKELIRDHDITIMEMVFP